MGVVYSAHDPQLDRKIALKLLRSDAVSPEERAPLRDRLLSEAQAMAKLAHPNVVAVHDVGSFGDSVFIAMELVDGQTLTRWLAERPRRWREVVAVFVAAGRGLAAAHAAGLVHRDFKPDNLLVGKDGRIRVSDFGLAQTVAPSTPTGDLDLDLAGAGAMTTTRELAGTPYYMAPEQHLGEVTSARSDQFSFCVVLYAALAGEHPFAASSYVELADAVTHGRLRPPPRRDRMPRWLHRVLIRGLSVAPGDRYPSIDDLLARLARDPVRQLWRGLAITLPAAALLGGGVLALRAHDARLMCQGAERKLAGVWEPQRARVIERAFRGSGHPHAAAAFDEVSRRLDRYTRSWVAMHTEACEATRIRGEQPESVLGLRMMCLDARLRGVRALTDRFASAGMELVDRAPHAVKALEPLTVCADVPALSSSARPNVAALTAAANDPPVGRCAVEDGKLWCTNSYDAPLRNKPSFRNPPSANVDHIYTTFSWFSCWSTGELHGGGNRTWYRTTGDQYGHWGWVAASFLKTTNDFDANPTKYGLPPCQYDWNNDPGK